MNSIERHLSIRSKNGQSTNLNITISMPYPTGENMYACKISAPGIINGQKEIFGIDSFQAVELSIDFFQRILLDISKQQEIFWADGEPYLEE